MPLTEVGDFIIAPDAGKRMETLYKVLASDGKDPDWDNIRWSLPDCDKPGEWMREMPVQYGVGYRLLRPEDLVQQLGPEIFEAEARGDTRPAEAKGGVLCDQARLLRRLHGWNETTARLFACDCAEGVLSMAWQRGPCKRAIATARRHAYGKGTHDELAYAHFAANRLAEPELWTGVVRLLAGSAVLGLTRWPWTALGWAMLWFAAWSLAQWASTAVRQKVRPDWGFARDYATSAAASAARPDPWEAAREAANNAAQAAAYAASASIPGSYHHRESFLAGWRAATLEQGKRLMGYLR